MRILWFQRMDDLKGFVEAALAAQEYYQQNLCINAGFGVGGCGVVQVLQTFFFATSKTDDGRSSFHAPRQATDDVIVRTYDKLGVHVVGIEFQNLFVIVPGADRIAQGGKPSVLNQRGVSSELGSRDAAGIECASIFGVHG